ncbi:hypothetical protein ACTA71_000374 [Dictyostelium dimigraforme]
MEGLPNTKLFINNEWVDPISKEKFKTYNPANGKLICEISEANELDVDIAVESSRNALNGEWGRMNGEERGKLILKLSNLIDQHREKLAYLETIDTGKPYRECLSYDIEESSKTLRYFGGWADKINGKYFPINENVTSITRHEPIGVVAAIVPWNYGLMVLCWKLGPALAAGCCFIGKPSELTPLSTLYFCDLIKEAGFPPGVINILNGYGHIVGNSLSSHMDIDLVSFTGSNEIGKLVMQSAAKSNLKPVVLELGGKSPNIIFEDYDVDLFIKKAKSYLFGNNMQVCCASSRIFVQESIYNSFIEKLKKMALSLKIGDPFDNDTNLGPLISKIQLERVLNFIEKGKSEGAHCYYGGNLIQYGDGNGNFIEPTIFTNVIDEMTICKEEIFGPIVLVIPFKTQEEVIKRANNTKYGLAAGVWTNDLNVAIDVSNKIKAGTCWINNYDFLSPQVPFGGYKQSGTGRDLSKYAIQSYLSVKAITISHEIKQSKY